MSGGGTRFPHERPATAEQALRTLLERLADYLRIRPGQDNRQALADLMDAFDQWKHLCE